MGGGQNRSSENTSVPQTLKQTINRREMLRKHFPDWEKRIDYQKKNKKKFINQPCGKSEKFKEYMH